MEIRVANESEKKLMDYICEYLGDSGVDLLEEHDEYKDTPDGITSDAYRFVQRLFCNTKVIVGENIGAVEVEDDICTGTCCVCGEELEGTFDGDDVTYEEYLDYIKKSQDGEVYCEKCWRKETGNA